MKYTFKGGTHVEEHKNTAGCAIEIMEAPAKISVPLSQHIGAPCTPIVKIGDTVTRGQMIGNVENALGCPVHSSVSGKVISIDSRNNAQGMPVQNIIIENDGLGTLCPDIKPLECDIAELSADELIEKIRLGGVSGMGGAMFPTYAKIRSALGKVDRIIVNCAECEPYITADCRVMIERTNELMTGIRILRHIFGLDRAYIAVEDNKPESIAAMRAAAGDDIEICVCKTKYPQGDERQMMYAVTGRKLPPGKLPADIGCVLFNASSCVAVYNAVVLGMPLIERVVETIGWGHLKELSRGSYAGNKDGLDRVAFMDLYKPAYERALQAATLPAALSATINKVRQLHPETDTFLLEAQNIRRQEDEKWERIMRRGYESLDAPETPNLLEDKK